MMESIKERLGPMVKERRKKLNTTQEELADRVEVTPGLLDKLNAVKRCRASIL